MEWKIDNSKYGYNDPEMLSNHEGETIFLMTLKELQDLKPSSPKTRLVNIFGKESIAEDANEDTRGGFVVYAILK